MKRHVNNETLPFGTVKSYDSSLYQGNDKVTRAGRNGQRDVTYRLRFDTGAEPSHNSFYADTEIAPDGTVWSGTFGGVDILRPATPAPHLKLR